MAAVAPITIDVVDVYVNVIWNMYSVLISKAHSGCEAVANI